jgi:hypothetical protein
MRDIALLLVHLLVTLARLTKPSGVRSVVAESVLIKHQLLILNRSRQRSPNLRVSDRFIAGLCALLIRPSRLVRSAITVRRAANRVSPARMPGPDVFLDNGRLGGEATRFPRFL